MGSAIMFGLNPLPFYAIIFLLGTNIAAGIGWYASSSAAASAKQQVVECKAEYQAFVSHAKAVGEIAKEKAKIEKIENERVANETANGWAAAVHHVRADRAGLAQRLRIAEPRRNSGGSGVSAPAQDQSGNARASSDSVPDPARVAADCAESTVTANYLQSYIERIEVGR